MILTASLFDVPHIMSLSLVNNTRAAYLSVPILEPGRNAKRKGDRLLGHLQCTRVDLIIYNYILLKYFIKLTWLILFFMKYLSILLNNMHEKKDILIRFD